MGIKERRTRERHELRQGILTAARTIAADEGWQAVTIRKVADQIEYSPPTIYEYFASKEAILQALALEGFRLLRTRIEAAAEGPGSPPARFAAVALAHCTFAWDHPELYQVMNNIGGASCHLDEPPPEILAIHHTVRAVVLAALGRPANDPAPLFDELDLFRATMHGLVAITMAGHLYGDQERATALAAQAAHGWLAAWREEGAAM